MYKNCDLNSEKEDRRFSYKEIFVLILAGYKAICPFILSLAAAIVILLIVIRCMI